MSQCTHDNCPFALVISPLPGLGMGSQTDPTDPGYDPEAPIQQYVALAGRVNVRTAFDLTPRTFVVSDGRGGVRAAAQAEAAYVIGFTINSTSSAQVGIVLKPLFGVVNP